MTGRNNISDVLTGALPSRLLMIGRAAAELAKKSGTQAVLVGGVVRDLLLGRRVVDADIMIETPVQPVVEALAGRFQCSFVSHPRFQTYTLELPDHKVDIVTAREETYPQPAALPVVKPASIDKDLRRRDFTVNAMVCRLDDALGDLIDPLGGRADLKARVIRALHERSFIDDPTRIYRAARFAGRMGFEIEGGTLKRIAAAVQDGMPDRLTPVRRRHEFELLLKEEDPMPALKMLAEWNALRGLHPDWSAADLGSLKLGEEKAGDARNAFVRRLARWFESWGEAKAERMMTDLGFERAVKKAVTQALKGA